MKRVLVVVGVILAAAGVVAYAFVWRPAEVGGRQLRNYADLQFYSSVLDRYHADNARYPANLDEALTWWAKQERELKPRERGSDGWGHQVYYVSNGEHFTLASFGRDNRPDQVLPWAAGGTPRNSKTPCGDPDADTIVFDNGVEQACSK